MAKKVAVYAGSFDPPTNGHRWMMAEGSSMFDQLIVALGVNPDKRSMFDVEDRLVMLRDLAADYPNVTVDSFTNQYLIRYAQKVGARYLLRGIRSGEDYQYEFRMRNINADIDPAVTTVFLMPPRDLAEVSSSLVKGLMGPENWEELVQGYVSPFVFEKLKQSYNER
jgi:pantetheine-phosphate adenylyltransferase